MIVCDTQSYVYTGKYICNIVAPPWDILSREGGDIGLLVHWSPKFYNNVSLFVALKTLGTSFITIFLFIKLGVQMFLLLILIWRSSYFVNHHWERNSIFWPLYYPFRSLQLKRYRGLHVGILSDYKFLSVFLGLATNKMGIR